MGYKILVADDSKMNLAIILTILRTSNNGYHLFSAQDGRQALHAAQIYKPDLIILNRSMPKLSGIETLRALKKFEATKDIPVIIETSFESAEDLGAALDTGAVDYMKIPPDPRELLARVNSALKIHTKLKNLQEQKVIVEQKIEELTNLETATNESSNSIIVLSGEGQMKWVNRGFTTVYGYSLFEFSKLHGGNFLNFREEVAELIQQNDLVTKAGKAEFISSIQTKKKQKKWLKGTVHSVLKEDEELEYVIIETDITQLKEIDEKLQTKNREMLELNHNLEKANMLLKKQQVEILKQKEAIEEEKQNTENLLLNILPYHVAAQLKDSGYARPRNYKMVTVMFTDFQGFTKACEKLSPDQIVAALHTFFAIFDDIIIDHYIEKIKTIGDSYMCAGGIPLRNRSNPFDVVLAGLKIQEFMRKVPFSEQYHLLPFWNLRVGIHTGPVTAGVVGKIKFAYDIWGDSVNISKRMESACEVGMVNISGTTYELIKDYFDCRYRGKIEIKNRGRMDMYFVLGIKDEYTDDPKKLVPNQKFRDFLNQL